MSQRPSSRMLVLDCDARGVRGWRCGLELNEAIGVPLAEREGSFHRVGVVLQG